MTSQKTDRLTKLHILKYINRLWTVGGQAQILAWGKYCYISIHTLISDFVSVEDFGYNKQFAILVTFVWKVNINEQAD